MTEDFSRGAQIVQLIHNSKTGKMERVPLPAPKPSRREIIEAAKQDILDKSGLGFVTDTGKRFPIDPDDAFDFHDGA